MSDTNKGRIPIPISILKERREMAVDLRAAGLSMKTVLKEINKLSAAKKWGTISMRTLERDIYQYYKSNQVVDDEERQFVSGLRKAHIAQMETIIEESIMITHKNKYLAPFEKMGIYEKVFKMQATMAEVQGWNVSKNRESTAINKNIIVEPVNQMDSSKIIEEILADKSIDLGRLGEELQEFARSDRAKELFEKFSSGTDDLHEGDYHEAEEA